MKPEMCPACQAAWGDIESGCAERHDSAVLGLALEIAQACGFHEVQLKEIGWFTDDAESVIDHLGKQESWNVVMTMETVRSPDGYDPLIEVNGVMFRCGEGPMSRYRAEPAGEEGST